MQQTEIWIPSTMDSTLQPSLFYRSDRSGKRPLLVGLHTWSWDRFNQIENMLPLAEKLGFHLLLPEFRGPNLVTNPNCTQACGSELAKQDIKDAIDHLLMTEEIDRDQIFLLGLSGGGHMALLMAGFCPEYFRAIGAYVGITDLEQWADQNAYYAPHVLACCSHDPEEMRKRSPVSYIDTIAKANVKIFHGKYDSSVPVTHSIRLFNLITEKYPQSRVYLDIFDGGHEIDLHTAEYWIQSQREATEKVQVSG